MVRGRRNPFGSLRSLKMGFTYHLSQHSPVEIGSTSFRISPQRNKKIFHRVNRAGNTPTSHKQEPTIRSDCFTTRISPLSGVPECNPGTKERQPRNEGIVSPPERRHKWLKVQPCYNYFTTTIQQSFSLPERICQPFYLHNFRKIKVFRFSDRLHFTLMFLHGAF